MSTTRSTSSARSPARIPIRPWCAISRSVIGNETRAQMLKARRPPAGSAGRLCRRRLQRHRHVPSLSRRSERARCMASRRRRRRRHRHAMPPRSPRARRACCMARAPICCRTRDGQIIEAHSISAGLDYPGVGPEHSWLQGYRPGEISLRHRQGGAGRLPAAAPAGRHHSGAGIGACHRPCARRSRRKMAEGPDHRGQSLGPRRQGHLLRRQRLGTKL